MSKATAWQVRAARRARGSFLCGTSLASLMLLALPATAQAQDQDRHWDENQTAVGSGGTGTWDTTSDVWSPSSDGVSGPYIAPWDNAALDNAIFGGTSGTVTLSGPITVHNLTANVGGYVLTGDTLTLAGVDPTISTIGTNTGFTINSVIAGTAGFTKAGAGTLTLNGANAFSGDIFLQAGTLSLNGDAALGAATNRVVTSGGVRLSSTGALASDRVVELGAGQAEITGAGVGSARFTGSGDLLARQDVTLDNDANDFTGEMRFLVNGYAYFTSVGDAGEASSLGAGDTIRFTAQNQYNDRLYYTGAGDSSNRDWVFDTSGGTSGSVFLNTGTGTLTLTGDIAANGAGTTIMVFAAESADLELLGTISSSNADRVIDLRGGGIGRTITLGDANTYAGGTNIGSAGLGATGPVTVRVSTLADTGTVSSFGTGTNGGIGIYSGSVVSYIGGGAGSNRDWTIGPAISASGFGGVLANDGTGALALSGTVTLAPGAYNGLLLGGSFAGTNTLSGIVSGDGMLGSSGSGTWVLSGANTRTGAILVDGGTLRAGNASAFGTTTGVTVNGGTLDLNGYDLETPTLEGAGGTIALGAGTLTVNATESTSFAGAITGTGGLAKMGAGTLTLTGANTYTGDTSLSGGGITLDFSAAGASASNIIAEDSTLNMAGGTLTLAGADGIANSQTFGGLNITAGSNRIVASSGAGGRMTVDLGAITRTGGLVDFALPTSGDFLTSSASLGGWATVDGSDYAKVVGGAITAFTAADYTNKDGAADWLTGDIVSDTENAADTPFFGTVASSQQLGGLKYTAAADSLVNIGTGATLGVDGTIIVASSVGDADQTITGGTMTGGVGGGTLGILKNGTGRFTIGSTIVDNGGATGFTKGGEGIVRLAGANTYTGVTTVSGGELQIASLAGAGLASSIGQASADSSNLVLESGMLHYVGGTDGSTDRGFTLVNGGASAPVIAVDGGRTIEFSGLVTSPDDAGLTKTGWGTLVLSNAANDYVGVTTIRGGGGSGNSTLSVNTLADGGIVSGMGAASSDSSNLVLSDGGRLQYTGGTVEIDRGFTLASGSGRIGVTQAATTLTVAGTAVGTGRLVKDGAGTLILSGTNSYTGGTTVTAGTLVAGSVRAFGGGEGGVGVGTLTVNAGATVDLADNSVFVGGLSGAGSVLLGAATLNINSAATFSGTISGTGGISVTRSTQTMLGCNNTYTGVTSLTTTLTVNCLANGGQASGIGAASSDPANLLIGGTLSYTGGSVTIDRGFTTTSGQIVVGNAAATLEFTGDTTGSGFIKDGAGTLVLSGASTRNGTTQIDDGTLRAGTINAFGSERINIVNAAGATLDLNGYDTSVRYLSGGGTTGGTVLLGGATLTFNAGGGGTGEFAGTISENGAIVKSGTYTQVFSGCASDYTGTTTINSGVLAVACLTDGGTTSSIGSSAADASNLVLNGGTLRYIGTGGSTDRQFTLGASAGNALDASGTGAITFTSTGPLTFAVADSAQTLTLTGTNTGNNSFAAQITDNGTGMTSLTKEGVGTWILTNPASDYTGVTRIEGGVLGVDKLSDGGVASSIGASTADAANLIIGNESTLRYTGAGDTTNRLFTLSSGVTFIESSGAGAIVFTDTGPVTLAADGEVRTIALGGTNTGNNTLAGSIGDAGAGVTTFAKNDSGTWILTGENTYSGSTNINAGILYLGDGGTTGSIQSALVNNSGTLGFNRSDDVMFAGEIVGTGSVLQAGTGTTILTGDSTYTGGTTISGGTLQLGDGGATGSIVGDVTNDGILAFNLSEAVTFDGVISGSGIVRQDGGGTTALTGTNSYTGGTVINGGRLQISRDANLGAASGAISLNGALETIADITSSRNVELRNTALLLVNAGITFRLDGVVSGAGTLDKRFGGTLILTADNLYTGGTTISAGTLQVGAGGMTGAITGDVDSDGALVFNRDGEFALAGVISGSGTVTQMGPGTVTLTGDNSYTGATDVTAGTLLVNGDQSLATGLTSVASGASLGGIGTIGGDVSIADGGILTPGNGGAGTLTIAGNLSLSDGSLLDYEFGQANVEGGALNDLVEVGGDLVLDGTIDVDVTAGGSFGGGIYRVFNYDGTLTDNGLELGTMPAGGSVTVQTSVDGQVNLVNSAGLALSFWDGDAGPKFDDTINGGDGTWRLGGVDNNWTDSEGAVNAVWADGTFAIFTGAAGTVTVDNGNGSVTASGMQFASDGYLVDGAALTLVGTQATIRVGDATVAGEDMTAEIAADLSGSAQVVKTDAGTLVLSGTNSYTGGTLIEGGTVRISSDANLGDAAGGLGLDGGTLNTTADIVSGRDITLAGAGRLLTDAGTTLELAGAVAGAGALTKDGAGMLVLTGDAAHGGGTTIAAGTLQVGNGGTTGSLVGDVLNGGALVFNRSDDTSFAGAITGTGLLRKDGAGNLTLSGVSSYDGQTDVRAGTLTLQAGSAITGTSGLMIAPVGGQTAEVVIDGASLTAADTSYSVVGSSGTGILTVQNGGTAHFNEFAIATGAGSTGTLNVIGVDSQVFTSGIPDHQIGLAGAAYINVLDGGLLSSAGAVTHIGSTPSGSGTVVVDGDDSRWFSRGHLNLGRGSITLSNGGGLGVSSGVLEMSHATAVLNIGGAAGDAATGAGALTSNVSIATVAGSTINFNHTDTAYDFVTAISGAGAINQLSGVTLLSGNSSGFSGLTSVSGGSLYVNNALGGDVTVETGGTLGGIGTIGGNVTVADGVLNPGDLGTAPGTLAIGGNLGLAAGSTINVSFGEANVVGGDFNDLIEVGGDLVLDGTLNVETAAGGSFDPGVYRVINYGGNLTDNGLGIGTIPSPDFYVQTSVAGQVNLVNTAGMTLRYWDGDTAASKNSGTIEGGNGLWQGSTGNDNWTEVTGAANAPFTDSAFAVFMGAAGTVTVDNSAGQVIASGMQFLTDGYLIEGGSIDLAGTASTIRVGDGTAGGAGITATIASDLNGTSQLVKTDLGTLILTGTNGYTGGTAINGGTLQVSSDANLGATAGGVSINGATLHTTTGFVTDRAIVLGGEGGTIHVDSALGVSGSISGSGALTKSGTGDLTLAAANTYTGGTVINEGSITATITGALGTGPVTVNNARLSFRNGANAGDLVIDNTLGGINFYDTTSAANAQLTITGGGLAFNDNSTAGDAVIVASFGGTVDFYQDASAGTATVTSTGGHVRFAGNSTADGAAIAGDLNSSVEIQNLASDGIAIGSLSGDGTVTLGSKILTLGGLGLDDTIGGVVEDGAAGSGGRLVKTGTGTLTLTGSNTYTGGTAINDGTVQIAADINLGAATGGLSFDGATLHTTADITSARAVDLVGAGTLDIDSGTTLALGGAISGAGGFTKLGDGTLILAGINSYDGPATIDAGTLFVNGDQSAATGLLTVNTGAALGGTGTIGGDVTLADGSILAAGANGVGTLTINGDLALSSGTVLDFEFGEAGVVGGTLNDLVNVGGDLTLDGTINVSVPAGGTFGPGIYRVFNYGGALTDNGLALGTMPGTSLDISVQTAIDGQVNLVNSGGLTLSFWDGAPGPKNNDTVDGGDGVWRVGGSTDNWTDPDGTINAAYAQDSFAVFSATGGTVTIDNVGGQVLAAGMQFASDGYLLTGDALTLTSANAIIQVGDGSAASAGYTATIEAELTGAAQLVKTDAGTLVLSGSNSYTGGTAINGGTIRIASDANLGDAAGGLSFDGGTLHTTADTASDRAVELSGAGTFLTDASTTLTLNGVVSGAGSLAKDGAGTLVLAADNGYAGGTTIADGTLQIGDGGTTGSITGDVANDGALAFNRSDDVTFAGVVSGSGALDQLGTGTLVLTADHSYTGGTTIGGGTLQLGDGGTTGSILGDVVNNGTLAFNRSDDVTFAGLVSGSGGIDQDGAGTLVLTGTNSYTGATNVNAGTLLVNGNQSAATGLTSVASGATLGGMGVIGGDVAVTDGGILAPGVDEPQTLTINGNLALSGGSTLAYEFGEANNPGGALNDLVNVGGDLTLDGTIDVAIADGGSFDIGLYRVANYGGVLTDNGLEIGVMPAGSDVFVQTAVDGEVNLINTGSALLNFWDGAAGPKFDNTVNGGDGVWQNGTGNYNWADASGAVNAPYADGAFAIFTGAAGTVTIDNGLGTVTASGMQFASDGYVLTGDALTLTAAQSVIRVGDGTTAGAGYTTTIEAELTGAAQLVKTDAGTLVLTGANSYTGGTAINGGTLRIGSDVNLGDAAGGVTFDGGTLNTTADIVSDRAIDLAGTGTFLTNGGTTLTLNGALSGGGSLAKTGAGTLILAGFGDNNGGISVGAGTLWVNGDFAGATGLTSVASGATLGGTGTIGGDVELADGAILTPGAGGAGSLTIGGDLSLSSGSTLAFEFGEANVAGGALNDLVTVGGDLTLDGTIDVAATAGGEFGAGVYRVFDYGGTLTDNGLSLGTLPAGSEVAVQTAIAGQVNLVNSAGLTLNFWDGAAGPKFDGAVNGGDGVWQNGTGNDNWTEAGGDVNAAYSDGAFAVFGGTGGTVTVDGGLGDVTSGGMQFAADGYTIDGDALTLVNPATTIRVGDGSTAGADYTATIDTVLTGDSQVIKTDAGTLILSGSNSYTGGTAISGGTVQIAADANLGDAAGDVTLDGGTLATSADLSSERDIVLAGAGTIDTAESTTFTFDGLLSGTGALTKQGAGTLLLTGDNSGYTADTTVAAGIFAVEGVLGGAVTVNDGARLTGGGQVGDVFNAGVIAPGLDGIGTLTVGAYNGNGGVLEIETELGGDNSPTDRLVVTGGTSGSTEIAVTNRGGLGAQTVEGIKIVDVTGGASDGTFALDGDYLFEGEQAVIAGAFGYRLYQGGVTTPADGDWYLRSALLAGPDEPDGPLYQPGAPLYENYGQTLQMLGALPTLQERVGNRSWSRSETGESNGIWGRMESSRSRPEARVSTTAADADTDSWQLQAGVDRTLLSAGNGSTLVAGVTAQYGTANAAISSPFGGGSIRVKSYGVGATLTWYAPDGFYADGQARFTWFDGRLKSSVLGTLADGNDGEGRAISLEAGKRSPIGGGFTITPQMQMSYQNVDFDTFEDPSEASVSSGKGDSLKSRWGIAVDHNAAWDANGASRRTHLYGLVNLSYEWLDGTRVDVSGTPLYNANERLWTEVAVGGSLLLDERLTIYTQASASSSVRDFGDSYNLKGVAGVRLAF